MMLEEYVRKLPYLLAVAAGVVSGLFLISKNAHTTTDLVSLCVVMCIFGIIGFPMRKVAQNILTTIEEQNIKRNEIATKDSVPENTSTGRVESLFDVKVDDNEPLEEFSPMEISEVLRRME